MDRCSWGFGRDCCPLAVMFVRIEDVGSDRDKKPEAGVSKLFSQTPAELRERRRPNFQVIEPLESISRNQIPLQFTTPRVHSRYGLGLRS